MGAFAVVFTGRKHGKIGQSLEALGHGFYGSVETELTKTVQILSKNSRSDRGGVSHHRPSLNMPLILNICSTVFFTYWHTAHVCQVSQRKTVEEAI